MPNTASYRNIAEVVGIETSDADEAEFVPRLVFNVLIGNQDMHLKSGAPIYPDGRTPALAPASDFVSTIADIPDDTAALKFARTWDTTRFSRDEPAYLEARPFAGEAGAGHGDEDGHAVPRRMTARATGTPDRERDGPGDRVSPREDPGRPGCRIAPNAVARRLNRPPWMPAPRPEVGASAQRGFCLRQARPVCRSAVTLRRTRPPRSG